MPKRTTSFRDELLADLADPQEAASYLNAAMEDSEEMFLVALRDVAEAKQMAKVAEGAGVARESVYRMLTAKGNPTYTSLLGILHAVGLKMAIAVESATGAQIGSSDEKVPSGKIFGISAGDTKVSRDLNLLVAGGDMACRWRAIGPQSAGAWRQGKGMAAAMSASQSPELLQASTK